MATEALQTRDQLVERWFTLTRRILPAMAAENEWPIALDHCFMRVCLDEALGAPWTTVVARPAIRTLSDAQLGAAIAVAESLVHQPTLLPALNDKSLRGRRFASANRLSS